MNAIYYLTRHFTQPAYRIKGIGLGRLCEIIRRVSARYASSQPLIIEDFRGKARFKCFLKEHMGGQIFFRGSYSGDQLTLIERLLTPNSVFIDIGANQGEFSITAAQKVPQGKVIAFEPVSEYRERLLENIRINQFTNISVIACALGEETGSLPIYDAIGSFTDGTRHEGLPSLFSTETRQQAREIVDIKRLDDVLDEQNISHVDLIKLDIEGAEWIALRGAKKTLEIYKPILILEIGKDTCNAAGYEPRELIEWLINLNYRIEKIIQGGQSQLINLDLLDDFQNVVAYPL